MGKDMDKCSEAPSAGWIPSRAYMNFPEYWAIRQGADLNLESGVRLQVVTAGLHRRNSIGNLKEVRKGNEARERRVRSIRGPWIGAGAAQDIQADNVPESKALEGKKWSSAGGRYLLQTISGSWPWQRVCPQGRRPWSIADRTAQANQYIVHTPGMCIGSTASPQREGARNAVVSIMEIDDRGGELRHGVVVGWLWAFVV
ncbi:hypothetical protein B0J11DRAFT_502322 [Dendryphion nanum]|uniref:Uncharacterized protein n=1 Tax=Dendryphion nanum TaxID=256645 RepID=A0A9P9EE90_9PLEO|nr:hypothetical protein B0J11DRAFT_502322 [Dendryphion nanum]